MVENHKKESYKTMETSFELITKIGKDEIVEEDVIDKGKMRIEKEESNNQGGQEERGVTIEQLIYKNSPWRRTKKKIVYDSNP